MGSHIGYTNYWERNAELSAEAFAAAVKDCRKIMKPIAVPLAGPDGTGKPIFRAEMIAFNGLTPEDYETFVVERVTTGRDGEPRIFQFCKTSRRPYDQCVQAALIVLKHHLGAAITVSSDGEDAEWKAARDNCQAHLGYGADFRLEK